MSALDGRTCGPSRLLVCGDREVPQLQAVAIVTLRTGETDANARLIAAAPDLLAACALFTKAAHETRDVLNGKGLACPALIALAAELARNAIAKAVQP